MNCLQDVHGLFMNCSWIVHGVLKRALNPSGGSLFDVFFEGNSIVVFRVVGAVKERDISLPGRVDYGPQGLPPGIQFGKVEVLELTPFLRVVSEPATERITGGCVLEPSFHMKGFLLHPARPKTLDQKSSPIT
jgi:hypothetical protein